MPSTIHLVTGGARSGKSGYAQRLCESICPNPIYLATSRAWDGDFIERIRKHKADRGDHWTTIEEPLKPSNAIEQLKGRVVMVDCLTLWLTNYFLEEGVFEVETSAGTDQHADDDKVQNATATVSLKAEAALARIKEEFDILTEPWNITFVFVTNELGSGTHASTNASRKFVDMQGWLNQYVASKACRVVHMVCGIPNVIKEELSSSRSGTTESVDVPSKEEIAKATMLDKYLSARGMDLDSKGYFLVKLDRPKGVIVASFHSTMKNDKGELCDLEGNKLTCCGESKTPEPLKVWECRTAKELTVEIFERWSHAKEVLSVGHAAYIGREAQKAEHGLYTGGYYRQD